MYIPVAWNATAVSRLEFDQMVGGLQGWEGAGSEREGSTETVS